MYTAVFAVPLEMFEEKFISWIYKRVEILDVDVDKELLTTLGVGIHQTSGDTRSFSEDKKNALIETLYEYIQMSPRNFYAHLQLGLIFYGAKDFVGALHHLTIASELLPTYSGSPNPRYVLALVYEELGDIQAMTLELEALFFLDPYAYDACLKLARLAQSGNVFTKVSTSWGSKTVPASRPI